MPNQIYSLNPSTIIVTSSFEENVKKLESVCIPPKHIIDIYMELPIYAGYQWFTIRMILFATVHRPSLRQRFASCSPKLDTMKTIIFCCLTLLIQKNLRKQ